VRGRGNSYGEAGGREANVKVWRADLSSSGSISLVTCCFHEIPPAVGAGDAVEKGEMVRDRLAAVKQVCRCWDPI
jgi:hypothetical protein